MIRVGILRQSRDFVPRRQNWFPSALPWVSSLANLHRNEKQAYLVIIGIGDLY